MKISPEFWEMGKDKTFVGLFLLLYFKFNFLDKSSPQKTRETS